MTTIALLSQSFDMAHLVEPIRRAAPQLRVALHGEPGAAEAEIAACWDPPRGALAAMPNLRLIHSIAAGVDNILSDPALPARPLCRVVDPQHARGMSEFVMWGVLHFHRQLDLVMRNQREAHWFRPRQSHPSRCTVGVMGLGEIGARVAADLRDAGFSVRGWARQPRVLDGIDVFAGEAGLAPFLRGTDTLVCLLPLTAQTRGILNRHTFDQLKPDARLIHVGRGEHLVTDDLMAALDSGRLGGAIVDVFAAEPLPPGDPIWRAPNLVVTPHMASVASEETIGEQIAQNALRLLAGHTLSNVVDLKRGY
ncbi:2-hydroxyacid dehydrogenase [Paraburkholderia tropica]|uniref:2-hydroxyacid dehydrogenase n=1 Tax=Paraburkholderia tropica TaxID=92647 RepID=UPI0007EC69F8|nr:glyoxylate/hydroxypyruvate reductase A [Paraburkholderia tropica]MBB2981887.1 glyoxylate/hydroxypyruvate reductase A [Paraburkholderia tropica]OBR51206.1 glyoxylate/hydroxypyruvate reductase A [Paraburkholderia tropica]